MIIAGWRKRYHVVAHAGIRTCPNCYHETEHFLLQEKREVRLYFIPVARWKSKCFLTCSVCSHQTVASPSEAERLVRADLGMS
jgi:hypothetical protein